MNPPSRDQTLPRLVVDSPDRIRGQVHVLDLEPLLVGRDTACRLQLIHPKISRRHALVSWADGHTTVEDLASTSGTRVNGHLVRGQQELHSGDVLDFGPLEVHYEEPGVEAATAVAGPPPDGTPAPQPDDPPAAAPPRVTSPPAGSPPGSPAPETPYPGTEPRFDVAEQWATGNLSNVGGNQYNYLMQDDRILAARRKAYFRRLRATRRTARRAALVGLLLAVLGFAFRSWLNSEQNVLDPRAGGVAIDGISLAVGIVGTVLFVLGAAVVAATVFRQRRYEREEDRRLNPDRPSPR
ncbi:FHA domain-containing protein [Streptomyces sp. NRRL B-24484]|uniref:FHA domain-containing protein n=1 Tax=Streptomyces sp. NRRL B-24484 TaxID=1463833 RepID=UPI0006937D6F|nr:FHA domain-containing protein [Streptomyces sp. NRRL B-24484]